jgi:type III secretion system low calcium response chaperone LcrH/SycD
MKLKELLQRLNKNSKSASIDLDNYFENFVEQKLLTSGTLQESFGVEKSEMELLYFEAYQAYQKDLFQEALELFRWLTILNPFEKKYWLGLGASQQLKTSYEPALKAYAIAYLLDCYDPFPHFHAFECYLALKDYPEAEKALLLAHEKACQNPLYRGLQAHIETRTLQLNTMKNPVYTAKK